LCHFDDISANPGVTIEPDAIRCAIDYQPQPRQKLLHTCPANEILFGGAAGPGKSHALRFEALLLCLRVPGLRAYLFRRTMPELERTHIIPALAQFPRDLVTYKASQQRFECINGSMLTFCGCPREADVFHYQGVELHLLCIDELTSFTEFQYDYLRSRLRCAIPVPPAYRHKIPGIRARPGNCGRPSGHCLCSKLPGLPWISRAAPVSLAGRPRRAGGDACACLTFRPQALATNPLPAGRATTGMPPRVARFARSPTATRPIWTAGFGYFPSGPQQPLPFQRPLPRPFAPRPRAPTTPPCLMTFRLGLMAAAVFPWALVGCGLDCRRERLSFRVRRCCYGPPTARPTRRWLRLTDQPAFCRRYRRARGPARGIGRAGHPGRVLAGPGPWFAGKKPDLPRVGGQGPSTAERFLAGPDWCSRRAIRRG